MKKEEKEKRKHLTWGKWQGQEREQQLQLTSTWMCINCHAWRSELLESMCTLKELLFFPSPSVTGWVKGSKFTSLASLLPTPFSTSWLFGPVLLWILRFFPHLISMISACHSFIPSFFPLSLFLHHACAKCSSREKEKWYKVCECMCVRVWVYVCVISTHGLTYEKERERD